jgi:hypothetical protein
MFDPTRSYIAEAAVVEAVLGLVGLTIAGLVLVRRTNLHRCPYLPVATSAEGSQLG